MRVAVIAPGTGLPYYCENCTRDGSVLRALAERGHEVACGSLCMPASVEGHGRREPVFYGAIRLFLGQVLPPLRAAPPWVRRTLDSRPLLRLAASLAGASDAGTMAPLTLSVLRGEEGAQASELEHLLRWLGEVRPDVLYLSNCLLLGIALRARRELGIPVACALQDEDTWIDAMALSDRDSAWAILRDRAADVNTFLPVSEYYGTLMSRRLGVGAERMTVVHPGIDIEGFPSEPSLLDADPPTIGFLSRLSDAMGLDILVKAVARLATSERHPRLKLRLAGGGTRNDPRFVHRFRSMFGRIGLRGRLEVLPSFAPKERIDFLSSIRVLSVPVPEGEAFGAFLLEAMAAGVPVVRPDLGGFPEVIGPSGAGVLYSPNTPEALAEALSGVLSDSCRARALGLAGFHAVRGRFTSFHAAGGLERVLQAIAAKPPAGGCEGGST
jgi:glycosyltransferase involved in cell wall biosynthesis